MAYVSSWRRDGMDTALGGAWRGVTDALETCVIPGCGSPVGAGGGACDDCRVAYVGVFDSVEASVVGADRVGCWLCDAPVLGAGAACPDCVPVVARRRQPLDSSLLGSPLLGSAV